jgi:hypothetical protein
MEAVRNFENRLVSTTLNGATSQKTVIFMYHRAHKILQSEPVLNEFDRV